MFSEMMEIVSPYLTLCLCVSGFPVIGLFNFCWLTPAVEGLDALLNTDTASKFLNYEGDIISVGIETLFYPLLDRVSLLARKRLLVFMLYVSPLDSCGSGRVSSLIIRVPDFSTLPFLLMIVRRRLFLLPCLLDLRLTDRTEVSLLFLLERYEKTSSCGA